ncbi:MAG: class I SAM-dependent methyltransferase [Campylobacterota bacterium]|nr:class I SAM-dependent methyltransferase [Campylobacterota bacterium]
MQKTLSYYENNAKHLSQRYESAKVDHIHALLLNTFPSNSYLLEIGCGSGRDAGFMQRNGYDVLAIDGSREMIAEANRCHPELADSLEVMKIPDELEFEPSSFDGVYSIAMLMHLDKSVIDQTIQKIAMLLKAGCKFFFSVSIQRDDVDDQGKDEKGRYFITMSELEWIAVCKKYGLKFTFIFS